MLGRFVTIPQETLEKQLQKMQTDMKPRRKKMYTKMTVFNLGLAKKINLGFNI